MGRYGFMEYDRSDFSELKNISSINKLYSMSDASIRPVRKLTREKMRNQL
jgi:hypothetical protein